MLFLLLHEASSILDKYENVSVFKRLTLIDNEFPGAAILLHKFGVVIKVLCVRACCPFQLIDC